MNEDTMMNEYNPIVNVWVENRAGFAVDRMFRVETTFDELFIDNPKLVANREMYAEELKTYGSFRPCDGVMIQLCT